MAYDSREVLWNTPLDEFEEQAVLPNGHYYIQIMGVARRVAEKTGTEWLDVTCQLVEPGADIEPSAINGFDLRDYEMRASFAVTKRAMFRIRAFTESLGFKGRPLDTVFNELTGMRALATVTTIEYTNRSGRTRPINNIDELVGIQQ